jgi:hypothetical protein
VQATLLGVLFSALLFQLFTFICQRGIGCVYKRASTRALTWWRGPQAASSNSNLPNVMELPPPLDSAMIPEVKKKK